MVVNNHSPSQHLYFLKGNVASEGGLGHTTFPWIVAKTPCTLTIGLGSCNNSATAAAVEDEEFFSCPSARQAAEATEGQGSFLRRERINRGENKKGIEAKNQAQFISKESGARNLGNGILGSFLDHLNDLRCERYFGRHNWSLFSVFWRFSGWLSSPKHWRLFIFAHLWPTTVVAHPPSVIINTSYMYWFIVGYSWEEEEQPGKGSSSRPSLEIYRYIKEWTWRIDMIRYALLFYSKLIFQVNRNPQRNLLDTLPIINIAPLKRKYSSWKIAFLLRLPLFRGCGYMILGEKYSRNSNHEVPKHQ